MITCEYCQKINYGDVANCIYCTAKLPFTRIPFLCTPIPTKFEILDYIRTGQITDLIRILHRIGFSAYDIISLIIRSYE